MNNALRCPFCLFVSVSWEPLLSHLGSDHPNSKVPGMLKEYIALGKWDPLDTTRVLMQISEEKWEAQKKRLEDIIAKVENVAREMKELNRRNPPYTTSRS